MYGVDRQSCRQVLFSQRMDGAACPIACPRSVLEGGINLLVEQLLMRQKRHGISNDRQTRLDEQAQRACRGQTTAPCFAAKASPCQTSSPHSFFRWRSQIVLDFGVNDTDTSSLENMAAAIRDYAATLAEMRDSACRCLVIRGKKAAGKPISHLIPAKPARSSDGSRLPNFGNEFWFSSPTTDLSILHAVSLSDDARQKPDLISGREVINTPR